MIIDQAQLYDRFITKVLAVSQKTRFGKYINKLLLETEQEILNEMKANFPEMKNIFSYFSEAELIQNLSFYMPLG